MDEYTQNIPWLSKEFDHMNETINPTLRFPWLQIGRLVLILAFIQGLRVAAGLIFRSLTVPDLFAWDVFQVVLFIFLGTGLVLLTRRYGVNLNFWPGLTSLKSRILYLGGSAFLLIMLFISFVLTRFDLSFMIFQLSSVVVVPLFEELLFRGFVWARLQKFITNGWKVLVVNMILFGLWHLGYADSVAFRMAQNGMPGDLFAIMLMKVVIGAAYGLVTGFVRLKGKNCSASFLLHALLNLFGK
jgi:membrane protease YdiL (CAAX protease family)